MPVELKVLGYAALLQFVGFDFGSIMPEDIPIPFGEKFTADFRWFDFGLAILFGSLTAILSGLSPARRAARLIIAKAMGTQAVK